MCRQSGRWRTEEYDVQAERQVEDRGIRCAGRAAGGGPRKTMSGMSGRWTDQRIRCEKLAEGRLTEEDDVKNEQNGRTKEYDVKNEQKVDAPRKTM